MEVTLLRTYAAGGTNGRLYINAAFQSYTIELPWLNNEPQVSCIPEGEYVLRRRYSLRHGLHLLVTGVKGRGLILLHPANNAIRELRGCIAPVTSLLKLPGQGSGSRLAMAKITALIFPALKTGIVTLIIKKDEHDFN